MWVAIFLGAWFVTSLLAGPWIGRFIASHIRVREERLPANPEPTVAKTAPMARRA